MHSQEKSQIVQIVKDMNNKDSEGPPAYTDEPVDISAAFSRLNLDLTSSVPIQDECIAHLKLLHAFQSLKEDIKVRDGLYGLRDEKVLSGMPVVSKDDNSKRKQTLERIQEKRWQVFVSRAVAKFEIWFEKQILPQSKQSSMDDMLHSRYKDCTKIEDKLSFSENDLPPLDVLMVWHSFMLNPRTYLSDCIRYGKMQLWRNGLPWNAINSAIDNHTFEYDPEEATKMNWFSATNIPWDYLQGEDIVNLSCYHCNSQISCPWTTYGSYADFQDGSPKDQSTGFSDPGFTAICTCGRSLNHDQLRVTKFMKDLQKLLLHNIPMAGNYLDKEGKPSPHSGGKDHSDYDDMMFPSKLLRQGGLATAFGDTSEPKVSTPTDIKCKFEEALSGDFAAVKKVYDRTTTTSAPYIWRSNRIAIRRMMACYWDSHTIFSMDLVGAVLRQGIFVEKMCNIDWLHSPALKSTMRRLIQKYTRFFMIMAQNPTQVVVPTLDVDLAWHTHQLAPQSYYQYSVLKTGNKFIDHDDKIGSAILSAAFEWTSKTYQKLFNSIYSECTCWYCEAVRDSSSTVLSRSILKKFSTPQQELRQLHKLDGSGDPRKTAHISAHNAINVSNDRDLLYFAATTVHKSKLETAYQRSVLKAKKSGRPPPERPQYPDHAYYPYMAYPFYMPIYVAAPACGTYTAGAVGNCCSGTCGGGVAMGACTAGSCGGAGFGAEGACTGRSYDNGGDDGGDTSNCSSCSGCGGCGGCG